MWVCTVRGDRYNWVAICGLVRPAATCSATRNSVGVSDAQPVLGRFLAPVAPNRTR